MIRVIMTKISLLIMHNENLPVQDTENFLAEKMKNSIAKILIFSILSSKH